MKSKNINYLFLIFLTLVSITYVESSPLFYSSPRNIKGYVVSVSHTDRCSQLGIENGICESNSGYLMKLIKVTAVWHDPNDTQVLNIPDGGVGYFNEMYIYNDSSLDLSQFVNKHVSIKEYQVYMNAYVNGSEFQSIEEEIVTDYPTEIGSVWKYSFPNFTDSIVCDTSINGKIYHKILRSGEIKGTYFFRDHGQQVLLYGGGTTEHLLYDFSDSIIVGGKVTLIPIDVVTDSIAIPFMKLEAHLNKFDGDVYTYWYNGHQITIHKKYGYIDDTHMCLGMSSCPEYSNILKTFCIKDSLVYENPNSYDESGISSVTSIQKSSGFNMVTHQNNIVLKVVDQSSESAINYNLLGMQLHLPTK